MSTPMRDPVPLLVPRPREITRTDQGVTLARTPALRFDRAGGCTRAAHRLIARLERLGVHPTVTESAPGGPDSTDISLAIDPTLGKPEGYLLVVEKDGISVKGSDDAGVFRGVSTLVQLAELGADGDSVVLPGIRVRDWPDFAHRGVMLDI